MYPLSRVKSTVLHYERQSFFCQFVYVYEFSCRILQQKSNLLGKIASFGAVLFVLQIVIYFGIVKVNYGTAENPDTVEPNSLIVSGILGVTELLFNVEVMCCAKIVSGIV